MPPTAIRLALAAGMLCAGCGQSQRAVMASGAGGAGSESGAAGEAGAPIVGTPLPVLGSRLIRFDRVTPALDEGTTPSLGRDLVVSFRLGDDGNVHALLSDPTPLVWELVPTDLGDRLLLSLSGIVGVSFSDGASIEDRWQGVWLDLTPDGGLAGTFVAGGYREVGFDGGPRLEGSGRVLEDDIGPVGRMAELPLAPWEEARLTFSEPVNASELQGAVVTLGKQSSQLGELAPTTYIEGGFAASSAAATVIQPGTPWSELVGARVRVDVSAIHDLAGNVATGSPVEHTFAPLPLGRPSLSLDEPGELLLIRGSGAPTAGSLEEELCEGRGCVVLPCQGTVRGVLDATGAKSFSLRWRAHGSPSAVSPPDLYHTPGVNVDRIREGVGELVHVGAFTALGGITLDDLDTDWSTYTTSLPDGDAPNVGFALSLAACTTETLIIDSISVAP